MDINATLIGQSISFFLFVFLCSRFVWPPIVAALRERERRIALGLQNAEEADRALKNAKGKAGDFLNEAKQQAAELVEQANRRANQMVESAKVKASDEAERIKQQARAEMEQEQNALRQNLQGKVAELAVLGAEHILQAHVDRAAHSRVLNDLAKQL
ncbi:MAG: F0F1 ATP synthase subunit B [Pseudomonadota bacterium]